MAWLPHSIAEAATETPPNGDVDLAAAWSHLLRRLESGAQTVGSDPASRNRVDLAAGMRHLLVLLAAGIDEALRFDPDPILCVQRASTTDLVSWGMECPDCLYTGAKLRGGESYRLFGNRGTARYVGLQTMKGIASTANALVDELEPDGDRAHRKVPTIDPDHVVSRQLAALGDFVHDNLEFFLQFGAAAPANGFLPPIDRTAMGAAAENKPVIGRWELGPDEALILEVEPPQGVYWSFSLGNPWWETIHYGRHQSSLNAHQAVVDSDGLVRVVLCARDPGVANWLDTAGHSNGPIILRCVRTATAPTPSTRVEAFDAIHAELPSDTTTVTPEERKSILAARRRAVRERFGQ